MWFGLLCRLWLWLFRVRGGFVCPFRRFAFGVGRPVWRRFRLSIMLGRAWGRVWLRCVRLFRFVCSRFGARVNRPRRNLVRKREVRAVFSPYLNFAPRIPPVKSAQSAGRSAGSLESADAMGPKRQTLSHSGAHKGRVVIRTIAFSY